MLNAIAARKNQLKKTETKQAKKVEALLCEDTETYNKLMSETFMEEYYSEIEEFSFGSVFFELKTEAAIAINKAYAEFSKECDSTKIEEIYASYEELQNLAKEIDEQSQKLQTAPNFFIRLSTRR